LRNYLKDGSVSSLQDLGEDLIDQSISRNCLYTFDKELRALR
jgi:hypothetical protein